MNNNVKCLFGYHEYTIPSEKDPKILMCKHCKRFGYLKYSDGYEIWYDYDKNGREIHYKDSLGYERWYDYDENGNLIYRKSSDGYITWLREGKWVYEKPKD